MRSAILRKKQLIIALIVHVLMPFVSMSAGKPMFYSDFSSVLPLVDVNYQEVSSIKEGFDLVVAGCFVKSTDISDLPDNMICTLSVYDSLVGKYYAESAPAGGAMKMIWWSHLLLALQNFPPNTYTLRAEVAYDGTSINQSRTFRVVPNNLGENYQEILESDGNIWYFTNRGGNVSAYNWFPQEAISSVGDSAMQSGLCGINGRSILQAQVTGPCIVQFDAMVAQIESGSKLRFYKNYRTQGVSPEKVWELSSQMISGTWKRFESSDIVACQPGLQEWIAWEFQRGSTRLDLCDLNAAWIDNVTRVEAVKAWFHPCGGSCDASIWVIPGKMYGEYESQVFPDAPAPPQDGRSYLFGGWYYDTTKIEKPEGGINGNMRHGDGVTPAGGVTRYSVVPKGKSSIDLYARWILVGEPHPDEELVTVSFNANGGSCSTTSRKVTKGAAVGTLPTATWSGYAFDGWYTSASGGTKVTATTKVAGNVTYYAHWTKNVTYCTVRFNANGGSCSTTSKTYASGSAIGTLPTATWDGYDFLGWYTAASGGSKVSESTVVTSDATWYAHWQVKASTYTIQFDAGADGSWTTTANQRRTCKLNTVYALDMPNGLTGLSGKRLAGWRCSNGKRYDPGVLFFNLAQAGKSVTMTAIWDGGGGQQKEYGGVQLWEGGPYWAECNVGATKPEEYGYYFWWGDTVGYKRNANNNGWISANDSARFLFLSYTCLSYGKDNSQLRSAGYTDEAGNLVASHDAATAHLGTPWRMPTDAEFSALIDKCMTTWITRNGVPGLLVTGKGAYSSKSIFLPAAGVGEDSDLYFLGSHGYYWSSTSYSDYSGGAWCLSFRSGHFDRSDDYRHVGQSVRPVR